MDDGSTCVHTSNLLYLQFIFYCEGVKAESCRGITLRTTIQQNLYCGRTFLHLTSLDLASSAEGPTHVLTQLKAGPLTRANSQHATKVTGKNKKCIEKTEEIWEPKQIPSEYAFFPIIPCERESGTGSRHR